MLEKWWKLMDCFGIAKAFGCIKLKASTFAIVVESKSTFNKGLIACHTNEYVFVETRCKVQFRGARVAARVHRATRLL